MKWTERTEYGKSWTQTRKGPMWLLKKANNKNFKPIRRKSAREKIEPFWII